MTGADYRLRPMTPAVADRISDWQYDPPFDFYDLDADPADYAAFVDPENWPNRTFAVRDARGALVGFFSFDETDAAVEVGLGMHPDYVGEGRGEAFVRAGLAFARDRYAPDEFRLAVAAFNERALRVYERVGFERVETFDQETNGGAYEFVRMRRDA